MSRIFVKARPAARQEYVVQLDALHFEVQVKEPARQGRANKAIAKALAKHLGVSAVSVRLVSGFASRQKVFDIHTSSHDVFAG